MSDGASTRGSGGGAKGVGRELDSQGHVRHTRFGARETVLWCRWTPISPIPTEEDVRSCCWAAHNGVTHSVGAMNPVMRTTGTSKSDLTATVGSCAGAAIERGWSRRRRSLPPAQV